MSSDFSLVITDRAKLGALQTRVIEQIDAVHRVEHENVVRRLCIGLGLIIIKESLKHGEFLPWLKSRTAKEVGYTNCTFMMRLAREWIDASKVARKEAAALPDNQFALDTQDAAMRRLVANAEKFVGKLSWTELLQKHGIKEQAKLGGARARNTANDTAPTDPEQLELFALDEIGGAILRAEQLLIAENRLQHLVKRPEAIRGVVESLRKLADQVEAAAKPLLKKG